MLAILAALLAAAPVGATGQDEATTVVRLRVLQDLNDPALVYVDNRSGRDWVTRVAVPLALDDGISKSGWFRYGDINVAVPLFEHTDLVTANVQVRVWQSVTNSMTLFISARGEGGRWDTLGTIWLRMDDGSVSGYRYDDVHIEVPTPDLSERPTSVAEFVWLDDVSPERQAKIRADLDHAMAFYADRFGLDPFPLALLVAADPDIADAGLRDLTGGSWALGATAYAGSSETYGPFVIFSDSTFALEVGRWDLGLRRTLAHEYFHMLQRLLSDNQHGAVPRWLEEGTAEYVSHAYMPAGIAYERGRYVDTGISMADRMRSAAIATGSFRSLEQAGTFNDLRRPGAHPGYDLGSLAVAWLVERAGEQAVIGFWQELRSSATWGEAFLTAFGMTTADFYEEFDEYRRATLRTPYRIHGTVVGPNGRPVGGLLVGIWESNPDPGVGKSNTGFDSMRIADDGVFDMWFLDGNFKIVLQAKDPDGRWRQLGWYVDGGIGVCSDATTIVLSGADVTGITITLPAAVSALPDIRPPDQRGNVCAR